MAPWDRIPCGVVEEILKHVDVFSRQRCAWTMKAWGKNMANIKAVNPTFLSSPDYLPPSIFGAMNLNATNVNFSFAELHSNRSYHVPVPGLMGQTRWLGAGEGWLVVALFVGPRSYNYFLVNPLTEEQILLPRKLFYLERALPTNMTVTSKK